MIIKTIIFFLFIIVLIIYSCCSMSSRKEHEQEDINIQTFDYEYEEQNKVKHISEQNMQHQSMLRFQSDSEKLQNKFNITQSHAGCYLCNYRDKNICEYRNVKCKNIDICEQIYKETHKPKYYHYSLTFEKLIGRKNCIYYYVTMDKNQEETIVRDSIVRNIELVQITRKEFERKANRNGQ